MQCANYQAILSRLEKVRPLRRELSWEARCPVHGDNRPSLLLWIGRRGDLLCQCRANRGCSFRAIVAATGTRVEDWWADRREVRVKRMATEQQPKPTTFYAYQDERGNLLYEVVRYEPKTFKVRRPDGHGRWAWNVEGVELVPYNLPAILAAPQQPIIVVEGEKDVESLRKLGLIGTCNAFGAGKWGWSLGKWLRGRRVAVIPDNDDAGRTHAAAVAGNLLSWGVASLRLVRLLGVADGGDVTDYLALRLPGQTDQQMRAALLDAIRHAPEYQLARVG